MEGAVLGVHRDDLGAGNLTGLAHHRRSGDDRLLVGQGQAATGIEGGEGHGQPGEAHHPVDGHVGHRGDVGQSLGPGHHLHAGGKGTGQLAGQRGIADGHDLGMEVTGLVGQEIDRSLGADGYH